MAELIRFKQSIPGLWVFLGDFNEVWEPHERLNYEFSQGNATVFNEFIRFADLFEFNMGGHRFTYMSGDGVKLSKLDMVLVCREFLGYWPDAKLTALSRFLFDHCPILLSVKSSDFGHVPFRFFNSWLELPGFVEYVNFICGKFVFSEPADVALATKLKWLKSRIRLWVNADRLRRESIYLENKKQVETLERLAERRNLSERLKALDMKQKARVKWALEGDENSKYYHCIIRLNTANNRIQGLK